ncbi:MAG: GNAT family N-acetyltransferase [Phycisphaerales bacterium JB064]
MANAITIKPATTEDAQDWLKMRESLGPDWVIDHVERMVAEYFTHGTIDRLPHTVLIAWRGDARVGMAEVSLRQFAEGCETSPVGYLEGWFVDASCRGMGVGKALVEAGKDWARSQGCTEFASDAEMDNLASQAAHEALGFEPVCDIRCYRVSLG